MQKLVSVFNALDPARRVLVFLATAAAFGAVMLIARGAGTPTMNLLYSGLDPAAAGEVIGTLEQQGAAFEVRGDAIYVDAARRDSLRMLLAAEGQPTSSVGGYEILDNLSGFGTTAQMFDAAYWRAKEGELARTILSQPGVSGARVHLSNAAQRSFMKNEPSSASVMVTTSGGALSAAQAHAIRFLVAAAVQGLMPDDVTVIDSITGVVGDANSAPEGRAAGGDRAAALRASVQRLLEARVGSGRVVVEVAVDRVTEREEIVERNFDPDSRVAISTVTEETNSSANDSRDGAVTVAGNLPDGDAGGQGADSSSSETGTREQVNYEVSETLREVLRLPGAVRRLTVAVLVDGIRTTGGDGTETWSPRPEDELSALRSLVASAVGFDEARGDEITLQSLEFPPIEEVGTEAAPIPLLTRLGIDAMQLIQIGVLALVALVLGLFVVRPILRAAPAPALPAPVAEPPTLPVAIETPAATPALPALDGEIDGELPPMSVVDIPPPDAALSAPDGGADPAARLAELANGRESETAMVLRSWMEEPEAAR